MGVVSRHLYHSNDAVSGEGRERRTHFFFRVIMQMWNLHTHGLLEFGDSLAFDALLMMNARKRTMAGRPCFFLFV
jgi:hypothetical protein